MATRTSGAPSLPTGLSGSPQLTLARALTTAENILKIFAAPLALAGLFVALAWIGLFAKLYPWLHLAALILFTAAFFDAFGKARRHYRPASVSEAKRRVEEASGLSHRPLDVLDDRPVAADAAQRELWQAHRMRARKETANLGWPKWKLSFAGRDPYALRYALVALLMVGALFGWGNWGGRLIAAVNPSLGNSLRFLEPALDAWITPPEYTGLPPIMIATPAGPRMDHQVIEVPEGSTITAHLAEKDGEAPRLAVNGASVDFAADDHQDFGVAQTITGGDSIAIRRGWRTLASWRIRVVADKAPQIALSEAPAPSERKAVKLGYEAHDDYGVTSVTALVTPRESLPGAPSKPVEVELAAPGAKDIKRVTYADLTASPWAGLGVEIKLFARDAAGHTAQSAPADLTLPERIFFNPVARALIEERKKLLQFPDDDAARNEAANVMAGIAAHHLAAFHGDPVVLLALRAGAVRLVLDRDHEAVPPVTDILWQSAVRIEDGGIGTAEAVLRQAQQDLADALDRNAGEEEIQKLIDRLHTALSNYLAQMSARLGSLAPAADLHQALGDRTNMLTPEDLERMMENMRTLSATGARDEARAELSRLQQMLESLRAGPSELTAEQKAAVQKLAALRALSKQQQDLLDETFREGQQGQTGAQLRKLALEQENLRKQLRSLIGEDAGDEDVEDLNAGDHAMDQASADLGQSAARSAARHQNDALAALQRAIKNMQESLQASIFMLPQQGRMAGRPDPFGRQGFGGFADDGGIKVPDRMEVRRVREILDELQRRAGDSDRPKTEREYIERLLQNF